MLSLLSTVVAFGVFLPGGYSADAKSARETRVKAAVLEILDSGLAENGSLNKAKSAFDRTALLRRDDSRIPYAWGLVLLKHHQAADAAKQFSVSAQQGDKSFLPAWKTLAWTHMLLRDQSEGLEAAAALAVNLATRAAKADSVGKDPSEEELAAAQWLSDFLMAAKSMARTQSEAENVESYSTQVESVFDGPLADAFEAGRETFSVRLKKLQAEAEQTQEKVRARKERKEQNRSEDIKSALENAEAEQADAKLLAEDAKTWLEETTRKIDRELGRLEKDYQFVSDQDKRIAQIMTENRKSMRLAELRRQTDLAPYRDLESQLFTLGQNRSELAAQATQTVRTGQRLIAARQAAIQKYEQVTGQLVKQDANLQKWKQRLNKEKELPQKSDGVSPVSRKLKSFRTLLPFDMAAARRELSLQIQGIQE
ncbi:MAG: hypothetical protein ACKVII_07025 [Planctomycetales bacterium]